MTLTKAVSVLCWEWKSDSNCSKNNFFALKWLKRGIRRGLFKRGWTVSSLKLERKMPVDRDQLILTFWNEAFVWECSLEKQQCILGLTEERFFFNCLRRGFSWAAIKWQCIMSKSVACSHILCSSPHLYCAFCRLSAHFLFFFFGPQSLFSNLFGMQEAAVFRGKKVLAGEHSCSFNN